MTLTAAPPESFQAPAPSGAVRRPTLPRARPARRPRAASARWRAGDGLAGRLRTPAARRRAADALIRARLVHLFPGALAPPGREAVSGPVSGSDPVEAVQPAAVGQPSHPPVPDGWPHGYGRRTKPAALPPLPPLATAPDPEPEPPAAVADLSPPTPEPAVTLDHDPDHDSGTTVRRKRRSLRLPAVLHPLLWADRKAVLGLGVLLLLAVAYAVQHFWIGRPEPVALPALAGKSARSAPAAVATEPEEAAAAPEPAPAADPEQSAEPAHPAAPPVVIDVAGKVLRPGLLTLPAGSRVADALRAAGGPQPGVETEGLNLARVLVDGEQVLVGVPGPAGGAAAQPGSGPRGPVSVNRATLEQLDALPGIGPVLARHILDFRAQHGAFRSLEQLREISGIGARKYAELRPLLTL
ncbi:helix-hairpin-helix domain-containing protein [Kitasatospora sp. NPDC006697]|uniref:helix-hairpin-helix domain-containing protein n=1 Tax=Kitasatospora sp. NPDC006697 TaxID=3364020 RepID=UPI00367A178F